MGQTTNYKLPYPDLPNTADVPRDMKALADAVDVVVAPPGVLQMWPGASAPMGWFLCQGQPVPAAANPGLAAIFGQAGGNVTLPDLRGKMLMGASPTYGLGTQGGAATVALSPAQTAVKGHTHPANTIASGGAHTHTTAAEAQEHTHTQVYATSASANASRGQSSSASPGGGQESLAYTNHFHNIALGTTNSGGRSAAHTHAIASSGAHTHATPALTLANGADGTPHENLPPYFAINFIIRGG